MIYIRVSSEQGSEFRVDDPCNLRVWMCLTKRRNCGQRMNDVAEGARLDDQDGFGAQGGRENYCAFGDFSGIVFREADPPWEARRWDGPRGDSSMRCLAECGFPS